MTKKAVMAVSGLFMILFLLMHMFGNLKLLLPDGRGHFNEYSEFLRDFLAPIMPHMWFLWLFRGLLIVAILAHMWAAFSLWTRNKRSTGNVRYKNYKGDSYTQFVMRWGGVTIILFLIAHLLQFTAEIIKVGYWDKARGADGHVIDSASRVVLGFQNPLVVLLYALAMLAVCAHVWRGFWSAFATLGANVSHAARRVLNACGLLVAALLFVGFMITPVMILIGAVK